MGDLGVFGAWLLLALVVGGAVCVAVGCVFVTRRIIARDARPEQNSFLSPFLTVVGLVYGALLGFTVVVGWQQFLSAETNVANEASTLTTLYRQTIAMPQQEQAQVREQLRKYAAAVQGPAWGMDEFADISNNGRAALGELYRIVGTHSSGPTASPIDSQFLSELTVLASDRSERILNARQRIPTLLWCALIFGGTVLILLTCFMRLENGRAHAILVGAVAILLSLLMYVIYTLDHPFGPIGVTSQPFSHAVKVFDMVDRGS